MCTRIEYTKTKIESIKSELKKHSNLDENICVIVTGSYGRGEASEVSDMDWFIVSKNDSCGSTLSNNDSLTLKTVTEVVNKNIDQNAGDTGTFENIITISKLLENFGGDKETNQDFTRRMLYLLESRCLYNESLYETLKTKILENYIKSDLLDSNINRFMLNDIIRYYRTMCTDYEYKVAEAGKSWGVRKIKLRFSRKLIYFSGLLTIADTCNLTRNEKITKTLKLLSLTPMERIKCIVGPDNVSELVRLYEYFLDEISKPEVREELNGVERNNRSETVIYRKLKNKSHNFAWEMEKLLKHNFPQSHPIHTALVF
ncbi:MAG: putative nucleotidyltransferase [Phenylobacterium sp.]|jgi:predicted nucleotidyltransferase